MSGHITPYPIHSNASKNSYGSPFFQFVFCVVYSLKPKKMLRPGPARKSTFPPPREIFRRRGRFAGLLFVRKCKQRKTGHHTLRSMGERGGWGCVKQPYTEALRGGVAGLWLSHEGGEKESKVMSLPHGPFPQPFAQPIPHQSFFENMSLSPRAATLRTTRAFPRHVRFPVDSASCHIYIHRIS